MLGRPEWLLATLVAFSPPLFWGSCESRASDRVRMRVARGTSETAMLLRKFTRTSHSRKGSSTTTHYVWLRLADQQLEREISSSDYSVAVEGEPVLWYRSEDGKDGFSQLEVGRLSDGQVFPYLLALGMTILLVKFWRSYIPGSARTRESSGSFPVPQASRFPPPPRGEPPVAWKAWTAQRRLLGFKVGIGVLLISGTLALVFVGLGTPGASLLAGFHGACALLVLILRGLRSRLRDSALWRNGTELTGQVSALYGEGAWTRLTAEYAIGGRVYELVRTLPSIWTSGLRAGGEVRVLVDPRSPLRATPAPA
jgi:hypothetical protein